METKVQRCKGRHSKATDAQQKTTGNKTVGPQTINSFKPSSLSNSGILLRQPAVAEGGQ